MSDTRKAQDGKPQRKDRDRKAQRKDGVQGEGDYEAARRFNESERDFVEQHGVAQQEALDPAQERELEAAEEQGRSRGRELDHEDEDEAIFKSGIEAGKREQRRDNRH